MNGQDIDVNKAFGEIMESLRDLHTRLDGIEKAVGYEGYTAAATRNLLDRVTRLEERVASIAERPERDANAPPIAPTEQPFAVVLEGVMRPVPGR
jgi:hypothetical protein